MSGFVHLHCHSVWSLLDGTIPAESLAYAARYLGFEAIALTDHDSLTGAVRFARACRDAGIKPIYGTEFTLENGDHITAIAKDAKGYANLCRLISDSHLNNERGKPATTFEKIAARAEGLFILSGCKSGEVARLAAAGAMPKAEAAALRWRDAIGDDYRLEVFDHRGYGDRLLRDRLLGIAKDTGIPAVATNDVHYPAPQDAGVHELLHAIKEIVPLSRTQALRNTSEYYLKDAIDMAELFYDCPDAVDETWRIAEQCEFDLDLGSYHFPEMPWLKGVSPTGELARRCYEGAALRYPTITREVDDRLQHELGMIQKMGFAGFFVLVAEIVRHIKKVMGIRCSCRGSAAGSLVCYVLEISDVDPIRYDLLFERFMNERREEIPDIDIDVESHRREEILRYIGDTYGAEQTAMCCMVDTFRARGAIREVGKALGMPLEEIDVVAKAFPRIAARDIPAAIERLPELAGTNLRAGQLEQLFHLCQEIDGFPRHLALHPSGMILSSRDLMDRVPMQESFQGFPMLQADKDDVEELGLAKLDVLGVRMLSSISHATQEIGRMTGEEVDLDSLSHDDEQAFELIRSSKTLGCFQIESPGQRELLARFQPNRFEDLIIDISLFRPGPVKSDMIKPFLNRRHGFAESNYSHESLRPILAETNGVVVYHEQVIRVIAAVTGCSLADADYVRRHLDAERPAAPDDPDDRPGRRPDGFGMTHGPKWEFAPGQEPKPGRGGMPSKRNQQIEIRPPENDVAKWFVSSAINNGFTPGKAKALWKEVFAFASFGFCKSHAAAFALPTYLSAWLKARHPAAFLAGVLTHDPGMYPRRLIVADARNSGVPIFPVDVNASFKTYRVEVDAQGKAGIRLALADVRDISETEITSILEARAAGPFTSLEDLWRRTEVSRPVLENLVHVGALDSVESTRRRRELLWRIVDLISEPKIRAGAQLALSLDEPVSESLPGLPAYTPLEETEAELDITGIDARRHIMSLYEPLLVELGCTSGDNLLRKRNDSWVWVAGVKVASQTPAIRSGQRIIFLTIDDLTGPIDVTIFERVQPRCARTVFHSWLQLVHGQVRKRGGASRVHRTDPNNVGITVVAEEVFDLAELAQDRNRGFSIKDAINRQRHKQAAAGLTAPRGDLKPTGRLWHASGGSAGR
ncbi:MAG TPA: DNA polymerase III subunit alpha [Actinomycetota bacterium]|nr:DNA polymerase III subunit alpha [Actinomycetota bacterium]